MEIIGGLLSFVGSMLFLAGFVLSIYYGFRRNLWWGIALIFLIPLAHIFFAFADTENRKSWLRLLLLSFVFLFIGGAIVSEPIVGFVLLGVVGVFAYLKRDLLHSLLPNFKYVQPKERESMGINFNAVRYKNLIKSHSYLWEQLQGVPTTYVAKKTFDNPDLIQDIKKFINRHFVGLSSSKITSNVVANDERMSLFQELMKSKHNLPPAQSVSLLFYVVSEMAYKQYSGSFGGVNADSKESLMKELVLSDIYQDQAPNFEFMQRLFVDKGLPVRSARNLPSNYEAMKKAIKLQHFEKTLGDTQTKPFRGIEEEIKSERQLVSINERISKYLDIDSNNYVIVGQDHSRDSRLDRYYKNHFSYVLSRAFDGHCCRCGEGMGQLEFDHFWHPKSSGGNFLMRSKRGVYINNCIPLCRSCNASKGKRDYRQFFTDEELVDIVRRSQSIETHINENMVNFDDPDFVGRAF